MSNRRRRVRAWLTQPVGTWTGWAWGSLVVAIPVAILGWWFGKYGSALLAGAAASGGMAVRLMLTSLRERRRRTALDPHGG